MPQKWGVHKCGMPQSLATLVMKTRSFW